MNIFTRILSHFRPAPTPKELFVVMNASGQLLTLPASREQTERSLVEWQNFRPKNPELNAGLRIEPYVEGK